MSKRKLTDEELAKREKARIDRKVAQAAIARIRTERPDILMLYIFEGLTLYEALEMAGYKIEDFYREVQAIESAKKQRNK